MTKRTLILIGAAVVLLAAAFISLVAEKKAVIKEYDDFVNGKPEDLKKEDLKPEDLKKEDLKKADDNGAGQTIN